VQQDTEMSATAEERAMGNGRQARSGRDEEEGAVEVAGVFVTREL
jgi:hypothetical protein